MRRLEDPFRAWFASAVPSTCDAPGIGVTARFAGAQDPINRGLRVSPAGDRAHRASYWPRSSHDHLAAQRDGDPRIGSLCNIRVPRFLRPRSPGVSSCGTSRHQHRESFSRAFTDSDISIRADIPALERRCPRGAQVPRRCCRASHRMHYGVRCRAAPVAAPRRPRAPSPRRDRPRTASARDQCRNLRHEISNWVQYQTLTLVPSRLRMPGRDLWSAASITAKRERVVEQHPSLETRRIPSSFVHLLPRSQSGCQQRCGDAHRQGRNVTFHLASITRKTNPDRRALKSNRAESGQCDESPKKNQLLFAAGIFLCL